MILKTKITKLFYFQNYLKNYEVSLILTKQIKQNSSNLNDIYGNVIFYIFNPLGIYSLVWHWELLWDKLVLYPMLWLTELLRWIFVEKLFYPIFEGYQIMRGLFFQCVDLAALWIFDIIKRGRDSGYLKRNKFTNKVYHEVYANKNNLLTKLIVIINFSYLVLLCSRINIRFF